MLINIQKNNNTNILYKYNSKVNITYRIYQKLLKKIILAYYINNNSKINKKLQPI